MILLQKEILTIILDFFGPDVSAVHILTSAVQIFRDHEDTVTELWWCGRAATEWLRDRRTERIKREIERKERARSRATLARALAAQTLAGHAQPGIAAELYGDVIERRR